MANNYNELYNTNDESMQRHYGETDFMEETSAEVSPVIRNNDNRTDNRDADNEGAGGRGIGWLALALSILSLFVMPVILGGAGIILGFVARRRGVTTLATWSIGIGVVSIILALFVIPFYARGFM